MLHNVSFKTDESSNPVLNEELRVGPADIYETNQSL